MRNLGRNTSTLSYMLILDVSIKLEYDHRVHFTDQIDLAGCVKPCVIEFSIVSLYKKGLYFDSGFRIAVLLETQDRVSNFRSRP